VDPTPSLARLLASLGAVRGPEASLDWVCQACTSGLGVSGASVALLVSGHDPGTIAASDGRASLLVDLQFGLGEGPSIDAFGTRRAVLEPDLATASCWPAFAPEAIASGAAAVFSLPLQVGSARFGALTLHRDRPGPLGQDILVDALVLAEVASEITLRLQAKMPPGSLHQVVEDLLAQRTVVYQATGMILVQLEVSPEDALVALRGRAYAEGRPVGEVAADVVARRLRFGS
jgi:hypothetical protein